MDNGHLCICNKHDHKWQSKGWGLGGGGVDILECVKIHAIYHK